MTTDNLGWLLPAWLLGAPFLFGLFELANLRSRRERVPRDFAQPNTDAYRTGRPV